MYINNLGQLTIHFAATWVLILFYVIFYNGPFQTSLFLQWLLHTIGRKMIKVMYLMDTKENWTKIDSVGLQLLIQPLLGSAVSVYRCL